MNGKPGDKQLITYQNLYLDIRRQFLRAGFPGAGLEAREIVCFGSGKTREEFYRDSPLYTSPEIEEAVRALAERHTGGEPVAYLIGEWEFYGLTLEVTPAVLIPRTDTEVLAEAAVEFAGRMERCRLLDLCTGSGCVGLAAAANVPGCRVLLGDVSEKALEVCRRNVRRCGLADRVKADVLDALAPPPASIGTFQCITCNPPYITRGEMETLDRSVKDFEPHLALCGGEDGLDFYRAIVRNWKAALTEGGRMYFEVGAGQADAVLGLMRNGGFADVNILPDTQGIGRVVYGTAPERKKMILEADPLKTEEISLRQVELAPDDPQRKWDPAFHFDILDRAGVQIGGCNLRLGHSEALYYAGNIGYQIDEPYRGHHYAGKACELLFQLARRQGMEYVIIVCAPGNQPSRKTCEWLGGELLEIAELPEDSEQRRLTGESHRCIFRFSL